MISSLNLQAEESSELPLILKQPKWAMVQELFNNLQISLKANFSHLTMTQKCISYFI